MMSSTEEEVGMTSPFVWSVTSDDGELALDEDVPAGSWIHSVHYVPDSSVIKEGEECARRALEDVEAIDCRAEEASDGDSSVDFMGSLEKETGGESEGFTFADVLQRADLISETALEILVDNPDLPLC